MKVLKFGGSSIGSADCIKNARKIIDANSGATVVVISAFKGVTDSLQKISKLAAKSDETYEPLFESLKTQHYQILEGLEIEKEPLKLAQTDLDLLLDDLTNIFQGIFLINDLSQKTSDKVLSYGERLSVSVMKYVLPNFEVLDASKLIKTNSSFNKHTPDINSSNELIREAYQGTKGKILIAGFISSSKIDASYTNLGRGGSDYTASILAAALDAEILEIWTDVDGFMSADPSIITNAHALDNLSYTEATELCNFGAKVIYPPTLFPVYNQNIPIRIRNTFNPESKGTYISHKLEEKRGEELIKGISSISDTCLLTVQGLGMVGVIGVNYRIFKALSKNGISVFLVAQASSENSTSIGLSSSDAKLAVEVIEEEFKQEISLGSINRIHTQYDLATIAVVGENMRETPGIAGRLFSTLGKDGINVIATAQGASEINISVVIKKKHLRKALNSIHDSFFLSDFKVLNLFIAGIGTVGGKLLEQIREQQIKLMEQYSLKLNLVGVARGSKALFSREGINLNTYKKDLEENGIVSSPSILLDNILEMNIFNAVFIDCTASEKLASIYFPLLNSNISIVAANKFAASSAYANYELLKQTARKRNVKFLFETNVGAGLPVINTMNALTNSGDKIIKLEAVLSGTLNYIFNTISADISFSKAIQMAKEEGFSEPDPRIDLSGLDVVRKLVILVREAGYKVEQSDVTKNLLVPQKYFDGSLDTFWSTISDLDGEFEEKRRKLEKDRKHLRFVAKYENGKCELGLQEVNQSHPFYELEGSNNIVQLTTERYNEYPMIIKGYGAGADVTAAGVFADIISIANIR